MTSVCGSAVAQESRPDCKHKRGREAPLNSPAGYRKLLDLRLAEFDVLARDRVVLLLDQLVGHGARILLGDVIEAGVRRGNELDLDGDRFGHVQDLKYLGNWEPANRPAFAAQPSFKTPKVKVWPVQTRSNPDI